MFYIIGFICFLFLMFLFSRLIQQSKNPSGFLGKRMMKLWNMCLELVLDKSKAPGKPGRKFQVPVVHRFDFYGNVPAAQRFLTAPQSCHTLYHCSTSVLPADAGLPSVFSQSYPIIIASGNGFVNSQSRKFR